MKAIADQKVPECQREGQTRWEMATSPARELVPGDVIHARLGDIVPADARLLAGEPVEVDRPALTGESLPAERKSPRQFFPILIIREGEIDALVYAAGANTYLGQDGATGEEAHAINPFSMHGAKDWPLPHHARGGSGRGHYYQYSAAIRSLRHYNSPWC